MTTTAAAAGTRRHTGSYPAEPRQVGLARAALAGWLGGCPRADEAILVASEFATNSVLHSASRHGDAFTLRAEVHPDCLRIEVEDAGGQWRGGPHDDGRPHGFDVVAAIAWAERSGIHVEHPWKPGWATPGSNRLAPVRVLVGLPAVRQSCGAHRHGRTPSRPCPQLPGAGEKA